jgi:hypothetical protein
LAQVISQVDAIENQVFEEVEGLCHFEADVRFGQKQTFALPPKAEMCGAARDVRFGPRADMMQRW